MNIPAARWPPTKEEIEDGVNSSLRAIGPTTESGYEAVRRVGVHLVGYFEYMHKKWAKIRDAQTDSRNYLIAENVARTHLSSSGVARTLELAAKRGLEELEQGGAQRGEPEPVKGQNAGAWGRDVGAEEEDTGSWARHANIAAKYAAKLGAYDVDSIHEAKHSAPFTPEQTSAIRAGMRRVIGNMKACESVGAGALACYLLGVSQEGGKNYGRICSDKSQSIEERMAAMGGAGACEGLERMMKVWLQETVRNAKTQMRKEARKDDDEDQHATNSPPRR